jgi:predicted CoA-binding protein
MADPWQAHLLTTSTQIRALLDTVRTVAVLGARPASMSHKADFYAIRPVVVHDHQDAQILGEPVHRRLADVPDPIDLVDVFRRPQDLPPHLDDILAARPRAVWLQSGIRHDEFAERLAREGIQVVQDRCLMVEYRVRGR